tara:strand:- start:13867 stop:17583 length:3717 start_codon:yes stop_codon:yes gene_type:complete
MNTKNLKAYAPKARSQFIEAIKKRAAQFGIYQDKIADVQFEGGVAIIEGRAFTKKQGEQRKALERKIEEKSLATHKERYDLFIREMAYTWFNRLAAIRYMELHDYLDHGFRVLSNPNNADSLPEILDHASDVVDILDPLSSSGQGYLDKNHIIELQLAGNKEEELYRELLLGQCHRLYNIMPFMFEAIDDATELLLPDNLTKTDSILKGLVYEIPEEDWSEIEVIGWLYQFYISEYKDSVIGKVVKSEDIPAATQLFTPNWIVKYLVQNSLGRQWLATYPESELKGKMEYYIEPAEQSDDVIEQLKAITPTSIDPEQIKVLDPAAGSGHILVEVYEVLREIYLERGYRLREIPELILTKNIYGLDIDDRAAQLAGFALMMKAREDDRRIFQRIEDGEVSLNVYSLQSTEGLDVGELWKALNLEENQKQGSTGGLFDESIAVIPSKVGIYKDYFELLQILKLAFIKAKTLGSLIQIDNQHLQNLVALKELLQAKEKGTDPSAKQAAINISPIINQAITLAQKYDAVVANPPYMGSKWMGNELKSFAIKKFPNSKSDLFSIFMERSFSLLTESGYNAQVNMQSWMFLSSYEKLREWLLKSKNIMCLMQIGYNSFPELNSKIVQCSAFCVQNTPINGYKGVYTNLNKAPQSANKNNVFLIRDPLLDFHLSSGDFEKIPGSPLAYWAGDNVLKAFSENRNLKHYIKPKQGTSTGDDETFVRYWHEVSLILLDKNSSSLDEALSCGGVYFPLNKGGDFRKWYGNHEKVIKLGGSAYSQLLEMGNNLPSRDLYFHAGITWSKITSSVFSCRLDPQGFVFSSVGLKGFPQADNSLYVLAFMNSIVMQHIVRMVSPTISIVSGDLEKVPVIFDDRYADKISHLAERVLEISKLDWDSSETSWNFRALPIIKATSLNCISSCLESIHNESQKLIEETVKKEEEINRIFIELYNLNDQLSPIVPLSQISLVQNTIFTNGKADKNIYFNNRIIELMSYSLGCMMGRFSLNGEGPIYANTGNSGFKELVAKGAYQKFPADDDGIVPLASEDWLFGDDATARFREFVKTVWGEKHLQENLEFVAESLCFNALKPAKNESANDTVRRYFSKQFYKDHCKTYKKRPIYWLFSSGKEKAFECLVYLHRYNEGTLSRMRTEYVTPLMGKYEAQHSLLAEQKIEATTTEARRIETELKSLEKKQAELRTFDEQLKHYAEMRITLDLDDGVKANYGKFGNLLADVKAIHGKLPEKVI